MGVFKGNCLEVSPFCMRGHSLAIACISAVIGHVIIHWIILAFVVPKFKCAEKEQAEHPYEEISAGTPCTWFTANPVHCLRSKHIYNHSPPCPYYIRGREHLMRANPKIGCYYDNPNKATIVE